MKKLREYQEKTIKILEDLEKKGSYSTVVNMPTGAGKTRVAVEYLVKNAISHSKKVLWLAHREYLLVQARGEFEKCAVESELINGKESKYQTISQGYDRLEDVTADTDVLFATTQSISGYKSLSETQEEFPKYRYLASWLGCQIEDNQIRKSERNTELYIILDEAHHIGGETVDHFFENLFGTNTGVTYTESQEEIRGGQKIVAKTKKMNLKDWGINSYYFIGLTATAFREDKFEAGFFKWFKDGYNFDVDKFTHSDIPLGHYGFSIVKGRKYSIDGEKLNQIAPIDMKQLIEQGFLIKPDIKSPITDFMDADRKEERFKKELLNDIEKRFLHSDQFKKMVIFVEDISQASELYIKAGDTALLCTSGGKRLNDSISELADESKESETIKTLKLFKQPNKFNVLIVVDIISEGYDLPELDAIVLTTPIKSRIRLRQRMGRVLRTADGKQEAAVYWYKFAGDYLEPSSFCEPINYKGVYASAFDIERYRNILDILSKFTDEELDDFVGVYRIDEVEIRLDDDLIKGFEQLHQRLKVDILFYSDIDSYQGYISAWAKEWEKTFEDAERLILEDIKKVCFFLCNIRKTVFHVTDQNIKDFMGAVLSNGCLLPKFCTNNEVELSKMIYKIMANREGDHAQNLEEVVKGIREILLKSYSHLLEDGSDKDCIIETAVKQFLENKKHKSNIVKEKAKEKMSEDGKIQEIPTVLKMLIEQGKEEKKLKRSYKKKGTATILNYKDMEGTEVTEEQLNDIKNLIFSGAFPTPERIKTVCTCRQCHKERPIVFMHFKDGVVQCETCSQKREIRQPYKLVKRFPYSGQIMAQSLIERKQHLVVSNRDITEFEDSIIQFLKGYNITKSGDEIKQLTCEYIARIGAKGTEDYLKEVIPYFEENVPRIIAYFLYEKVYDKVYEKLLIDKDFFGKRTDSDESQKQNDLLKESHILLSEYGLREDFFCAYQLDLVADIIIDYTPYRKVIQHYQGIKPELLCRMQNMLLAQAMVSEPLVKQHISAFGGSGADLLNRVNFPDSIETEVFNEIGELPTAFYRTLGNSEQYEKLKKLIEEFIDSILCAKEEHTWEFLLDLEPKGKGAEKLQELVKLRFNESNLKIGKNVWESGMEQAKDRLERQYSRYFSDDSFLKELEKREEILFGMHQKLLLMYKQFQYELPRENVNRLQEDHQKAFIFFISLNFSDRQLFNDCTIDKFINLCVHYEDWLMFGQERCRSIKVRTGDALTLVEELEYNNCETIVYMDIPYSETDSSTYFSDFFDVSKFISVLDRFKSKYIVSSRFNICMDSTWKADYYGVEKTAGDDEKTTYWYDGKFGLDKSRFVTDFYRSFILPIEDQISEYGHIGSVENQAKYIIMPFTDAQKLIIQEEDKQRELLVRNNTVLSIEDVRRMLIRTVFTNIPIEVMITNLEFMRSKERSMMEAYELEKGNVWAIPSVEFMGSVNSAYHATPVYIAFKYEKFLELQSDAIKYEEYVEKELEKELEKARNTASAFNYFARKKYAKTGVSDQGL